MSGRRRAKTRATLAMLREWNEANRIMRKPEWQRDGGRETIPARVEIRGARVSGRGTGEPVVHAMGQCYTKCGRWLTGGLAYIYYSIGRQWQGVTCKACIRVIGALRAAKAAK